MRVWPMPPSGHASPNWGAPSFPALPPISGSSSPTKSTNGARWSSSQARSRSDLAKFHNLSLREISCNQSRRRLEREASRNVEVMWITGRLVPDHKTIADFRKDNGPAIRKVCAQFVALCREMGLLTKASVAIDGSKFKAVNNRDKNFTRAKMERRLAQIEESVARYLSQLDTADLQEPSEALASKTAHLKEKLAKLASE